MLKDLQARASDNDRDRAVLRLQQAFGEGRLLPEEMDDRLERALTARTHGELESALAHLPDHPKDKAVQLKSTNGQVRRGREWRVPAVLRIDSEYGGVKLDLSRAVIEHPVIEIDLQLRYGAARIVLPKGATVDIDEVTTEWGSTIYRPPRRSDPSRVHVRITGHLGYGRLRVRHRRAWF